MSEFSKRVSVMANEVKNLKVLTESLVSPDIISFAGGAPAKEAYPLKSSATLPRKCSSRTPEGSDQWFMERPWA